jgi:hypothetical protein
MMPNAQLVKSRVTVLARRGDHKIPGGAPSNSSSARRRAVAGDRRGRGRAHARGDRPCCRVAARICTCRSFDDNSIRYAVLYWLADPAFDFVTDPQVRTHVFATLSRHHMEMPLPRRVLLTPDAVDAQHHATSARELTSRLDVLSRLSLFAELTEGERRALAAELSDAPYVAGDVISREGEVSDSLFILATGNVEIIRDAAGASDERKHLADMAAPDHFGEMGLLTGQARSATVIARDEVLATGWRNADWMRSSRRVRRSPKRWRRW